MTLATSSFSRRTLSSLLFLFDERRLPMQELKDVVEKLRNDHPLEGDVVVEEAIESMVPTYPSSKHGV